MNLEIFLVMLDIGAGAALLARSFSAIVRMGHRTRHCIRTIYISLACGSVAMMCAPAMDVEWRRYAHVAVITALAALALFERRRGRELLTPRGTHDHAR